MDDASDAAETGTVDSRDRLFLKLPANLEEMTSEELEAYVGQLHAAIVARLRDGTR